MYRKGNPCAALSVARDYLPGHLSGLDDPGDLFPMVSAVFEVFLDYRDEWPGFAQYLQQASRPEYRADGVTLVAPRQIYAGHGMLAPNPGLLEALRQAGAITEIGVSYSRCRLRFADERVLSWLCDGGAWVKLYLYAVICRRGLVDGAAIDVALRWGDADDEDAVSKADVLAVRSGRLFLFSCEAGTANVAALNELAVLTHCFGGRGACGILATAAWRSELSRALVTRAEAMEIELLTREDLDVAHVDERLERLFEEQEKNA